MKKIITEEIEIELYDELSQLALKNCMNGGIVREAIIYYLYSADFTKLLSDFNDRFSYLRK